LTTFDNIWQLLAKFEGPKDKYNSLVLPVLFPSWHLPPPLRITSLLCQRCQCGLLLGAWNVASLSVWLCLYVYMICVHQCKELSFHFATGFSWHIYEEMSLTLNDVFRDPTSNEATGHCNTGDFLCDLGSVLSLIDWDHMGRQSRSRTNH
jgi:hypothetical protein